MARQRGKEQKLKSTNLKVGKNEFVLLNDEKLGRVIEVLEGIREPEGDEAHAYQEAKKMFKDDVDSIILALYDRLGGGIRLGDRKLKIGAFYDFPAHKPLEKADLTEEDYADEMVLVPKKTDKKKERETTVQKVARLKKSKK